MPVIEHYDALIEMAKAKREVKVVVPSPESENLIEGLAMASHLAYPILVGDEKKIRPLLEKCGLEADVINVPDMHEALYKALEIVRGGGADMIMKGKDDTPTFMHAVLDKEKGIRTGKLLSHITCLEIPGYHKLLFVTDAGIIIRPNLEQKLNMMDNLLGVLKKLGYDRPKIAMLASLEVPSPDMPETLEAAAMAKFAERGRFGSAIVDGPLALDVALDPESVKIKGLSGEVMGDADVLFVPDVVTGNVFCKAMVLFARAKMGGFIAGAKVPIVFLSRADTPERKLYSIAFAVAAG
jgi:phosphate butyryltransferase